MVELRRQLGWRLMDTGTAKLVALGGAAAVVALVLYKVATKGAAAAKTLVTETLNPASSNNIVNQGVTSLGAAVTGDKSFTLGGWFYDATHTDPMVQMDQAAAQRISDANAAEIASLLARYPAPAPPATDHYDALGNYIGNY